MNFAFLITGIVLIVGQNIWATTNNGNKINSNQVNSQQNLPFIGLSTNQEQDNQTNEDDETIVPNYYIYIPISEYFLKHFHKIEILKLIRQWLEQIQITNPKIARILCKIIPVSCPFEGNLQVFGKTLFHIPPLCQLNPFYKELVELRFRALIFLVDVCGEDLF